jgi:hypothetical protein
VQASSVASHDQYDFQKDSQNLLFPIYLGHMLVMNIAQRLPGIAAHPSMRSLLMPSIAVAIFATHLVSILINAAGKRSPSMLVLMISAHGLPTSARNAHPYMRSEV